MNSSQKRPLSEVRHFGLESFPNHSLPSQNLPLQRTRGALHLLTLFFLSPHPPTLFCYHNIHPGGSNIAVLQDK